MLLGSTAQRHVNRLAQNLGVTPGSPVSRRHVFAAQQYQQTWGVQLFSYNFRQLEADLMRPQQHSWPVE